MGIPAIALGGALLFALWPLAIWVEVDLLLEKPRYNTTLTLPRGVELRSYEVRTEGAPPRVVTSTFGRSADHPVSSTHPSVPHEVLGAFFS